MLGSVFLDAILGTDKVIFEDVDDGIRDLACAVALAVHVGAEPGSESEEAFSDFGRAAGCGRQAW